MYLNIFLTWDLTNFSTSISDCANLVLSPQRAILQLCYSLNLLSTSDIPCLFVSSHLTAGFREVVLKFMKKDK